MIQVGRLAGVSGLQQMLGKDDAGAGPWPVSPFVALANAIEPVAWRNHPRVRRRTLQVFAEVFKDSGMLRWDSGEVVECLVDPGR